MLREWIAVAVGGALGASLRHLLSSLFAVIGPTWLPLATLFANVLGCFAIGAIVQWSLTHEISKEWWVTGIRVGLLGGLTTFSSFGHDIVKLWHDDRAHFSIGLALAHIALGLTAVAAGLAWMQSRGDQ